MIVLSEYKLLQKLMGLNPRGGHGNLAIRFFYLVAALSGVVAFTIFFVLNVHKDIYRAASGLPPIIAFILFMTNYMHLLIRRKRFYSLIDKLQKIVDGSTK